MATRQSNVSDIDRARTRRARAQILNADRIKSITSKKDLTDALNAYDDVFLECRDLRHPWKLVGYYRSGGIVSRRLLCPRCDTERIDEWRRNGERLESRYVYPIGYQLKGSGGVSPQDIRKQVLARVEIFATEDDLLSSLTNGRKTNGRH